MPPSRHNASDIMKVQIESPPSLLSRCLIVVCHLKSRADQLLGDDVTFKNTSWRQVSEHLSSGGWGGGHKWNGVLAAEKGQQVNLGWCVLLILDERGSA